MNEEPAIVVKKLYKTFKLPHERHNGLKQLLLNVFKGHKGFKTQHVLSDINFEIKQGDFFGIVGRNGSGKSTLLKLLAGIYAPDKGLIRVNGPLTPFIELGVGFNPELTGRENIFMNGALLGFDRAEMQEMYDDIVSFAELENYMDQKLKNYSSGMQVRLAFSIAIRAKSAILLLDEVLAVGDAIFQKKCYNYFRELKKEGRTVVFISHDANALLEFCTNGILIDNGRIKSRGKITKVVNDYLDLLNDSEEELNKKENKQKKDRWGNGDIVINSIALSNAYQKKINTFTEKDEVINVEVEYIAQKNVEEPIYGITITDATDQRIFSSNTMWAKQKTRAVKKGETTKVTWEVPNLFNTGDFSVSPAAADKRGAVIYDWVEGGSYFKVRKQQPSNSFTNTKHNIIISYS